jgi:hypothetical protein
MRMPIAFQYTPRIPDNFQWWCDVEGCHYNIYLLNLTQEDLAILDGETAAKLRLQDWSLSDPWVQLAFKVMVEDHRVKHLESWGLQCLRGPSGVYVQVHPFVAVPSLTISPFRRSSASSLPNPLDQTERRTSSRT